MQCFFCLVAHGRRSVLTATDTPTLNRPTNRINERQHRHRINSPVSQAPYNISTETIRAPLSAHSHTNTPMLNLPENKTIN